MHRKTPFLASYLCGVVLSASCAVPEQKQPLEYRLAQEGKVQVLGEVTSHSLRTLERVIRHLPYVDACDVVLYNAAMWEVFKSTSIIEKNTGGCYFDATEKIRAQIWLPYPVDSEVATHEFAHRRTQALGDAYLQRWAATNKYAYGKDITLVNNLTVWIDGTDTPRYGFVSPYGRKNAKEDIATLTAFIRHTLPEKKRIHIDKESAGILKKKIQLLEEGKFIHSQEAYEVSCWLRTLSLK